MKALIAMSGGVDSSIAAFLMKKAGFDCTGCTMLLYGRSVTESSAGRTCCSLDDVEDARSVAYRLNIPFYVFNFKDAFRSSIMEPFAEAYLLGLTPNPCIDCNRCMKFGALLDRALMLGYDKLATGHYARIRFDGERYRLFKAADPAKDQSYVLYQLTQEQLAHLAFPLGEYSKDQVRAIAEREGFLNAKKPDSQDICFVPDGNYATVVEALTGRTSVPGDFTDRDGRVLGRHRGIIHYTIGQRKGLGLSFPQPMYVTAIDPIANTVTLGPHEELFSRRVRVPAFHWISGRSAEEPLRGQAKLRYRQKASPVTALPQPDGSVLLEFDEPQRAVTPGQSAVLYRDDEVLGGGIIA